MSKTECSVVFPNDSFSSSSAGTMRVFFPADTDCGNLIELLEVKFIEVWRSSCDFIPHLDFTVLQKGSSVKVVNSDF